MALTTTAEMMTAMGVANTPINFNRYEILRKQVEAGILSYLKWDLQQATVTDYYDGTGYRDITLRRPFVASVANVWVDASGYYGQGPSAFGSDTLQTAGQDYVLVIDDNTGGKSGLLRRLVTPLLLWPSDLVFSRQPGGLSFRGPAVWPQGYGCVKVEYTYGFATIPDEIKMAVESGCAIAANTTKWGFPSQSESVGGHNWSLLISREPEFSTTRQILSRYRDISIGLGL